MVVVARHRAAIRRREFSRPVRAAVDDGLLATGVTFFDFGCGHGDDLRLLEECGIRGAGWDPVHRADVSLAQAELVNFGYVVNVIEDRSEREETLRSAWNLATRVLVVAARVVNEAPPSPGETFADGYLTRLGTFQKFFEQRELATWIEDVLKVSPVAAELGVFYVFRSDADREAFLATRVRRAPASARPRASTLFDAHREVLEPLVDFLNTRGRLPEIGELPDSDAVVATLGSHQRACSIVRRAIGSESIADVQLLRSEDLLVYLALARLRRRPRFAALPRALQLDVRAFFRSYERACVLADEVLMAAGDMSLVDQACRRSGVGKLTPAALYVHTSALADAPPLLRVYEGCASGYVGAVAGANIIKLHRGEPRVSYLSYPRFEVDAHPSLATSLVVSLQTFRLETRDYRTSKNPPILHRKESFVAGDHVLREKFARLTAQEERAGLFTRTEAIGTRQGWDEVLAMRGVRLRGHRLERR